MAPHLQPFWQNKRLLLAPLWSKPEVVTAALLNDMATSISQVCGDSSNVSCYLNYAAKQLKANLISKFKSLYYIDEPLYHGHDYAYMFEMADNGRKLHLILSGKPLLEAANGAVEAFRLTNEKYFRAPFVAQGSSLALAAALQARVILILDVAELGKQSLFLLEEMLNDNQIARHIEAFALYNATPEAADAWESLLLRKFSKPLLFVNGKCRDTKLFEQLLRRPNADYSATQGSDYRQSDYGQAEIRTAVYNRDNKNIYGQTATRAVNYGHGQTGFSDGSGMDAYMHLSSKIYKRCTALNLSDRKIKVALAYDEAFNAYDAYELEILTQLGIEWHFFSPLRAQTLPAGCEAVYMRSDNLPSFKEALCNNRALRQELKNCYHEHKMLIIAQDLAYLYLLDGFLDEKNTYWPMAGLISQKARLNALNTFNFNTFNAFTPSTVYRYAVATALKDNCFAVKMQANLALLNTAVELQSTLQGLRVVTALDCESHLQVVQAGYCDRYIFASLLSFLPTSNLEWTEHFFMQLLQFKAAKLANRL